MRDIWKLITKKIIGGIWKEIAEAIFGDYSECIQAKADKMKDTWYKDSDGTWKKLPYKGEAKFLFECMPVSPLILDLDGDGVEADAIAFFDHEGDGWAELSRWADEDDGTLVWDRNNDGVINDGSELFGNNTVLSNGSKAAHGFAALADLDDNGDGVIDSSDAAWTELQIMRWTDDNNNGIKDDGEEFLVTLDSLGIESLNTGFTNSNHVDAVGNEHRQVGSFTKTVINDDGTTETVTSKMTDVWFVTNTDVTQYDDTDIPEHSEAIETLPNINGGGRVYNLRDAMALEMLRMPMATVV